MMLYIRKHVDLLNDDLARQGLPLIKPQDLNVDGDIKLA